MWIRNQADLMQCQAQLFQVASGLAEGKTFDVTIEPHKEKRSLNANNYSWLIQGEIAKVLNKPLDEIHKQMIMQYGVLETISVVKEAWESCQRAFDYWMILGEGQVNGRTFVHARVGVGTHQYNTKEMAKFINGIVEEARSLDIQTFEDKRIQELVTKWEQQR